MGTTINNAKEAGAGAVCLTEVSLAELEQVEGGLFAPFIFTVVAGPPALGLGITCGDGGIQPLRLLALC